MMHLIVSPKLKSGGEAWEGRENIHGEKNYFTVKSAQRTHRDIFLHREKDNE